MTNDELNIGDVILCGLLSRNRERKILHLNSQKFDETFIVLGFLVERRDLIAVQTDRGRLFIGRGNAGEHCIVLKRGQ